MRSTRITARLARWGWVALAVWGMSVAQPAASQSQPATKAAEFVPREGQPGKDVIWLPTPDRLAERMLRMAQVTPSDTVVDLGSGDGKIVIAAAKLFKTRALGIEYNPDMVAVSKVNAAKAGVADLASFMQGDIFAVDFSNATVVTMYLLPNLNLQLRPILLQMKPGTRVVSHQFSMGDWDPDETSTVEGRPGYLWVIPANVGGSWHFETIDAAGKTETGALSFDQSYQKISGNVRYAILQATLRDPLLNGANISFGFMGQDGILRRYAGTVNGNRIEGTAVGASGTAPFTAVRKSLIEPIKGSHS